MEDGRTRYCRSCNQLYAHNVFTCPICNIPTALLNHRILRAKSKSNSNIALCIVSVVILFLLALVCFDNGSFNTQNFFVSASLFEFVILLIFLIIESIRKQPKKHILIGMAVCFVVFIVTANSNESKDISSDLTYTPIRPNVTFAPKQTVKPEPTFTPISGTVGNWEITVNNFSYQKTISAGVFREYTANENSKYCLVNVTAKNIGTEANTFLPYISFENSITVKIEWNGYEYTRSELLFSNDVLSNEQLNPLVTATGNIVFDVPEDLISSDIPPIFIIKTDTESFYCELVKK